MTKKASGYGISTVQHTKTELQIEIDTGSGFCFGVTTAIKKAEEELAEGKTLYCLGDSAQRNGG